MSETRPVTGDFSRLTFEREKHYRSVRLQQGRMLLDADWNERADIDAYRRETETVDVIGGSGTPKHESGFQPSLVEGRLSIGKGLYYVEGLLCRQSEAGLRFSTPLPDLAPGSASPQPGIYVVYLEVFDRLVDAGEDPDLREPALGGPDTAVRLATAWKIGFEWFAGLDAPLDRRALGADWAPHLVETDHRYAPLALARFDGGSWTAVTDCRATFAPLTEPVEAEAEPGIHVVAVLARDAGGREKRLRNDAELARAALAQGLCIVCDHALEPSALRALPTCSVAIEVTRPLVVEGRAGPTAMRGRRSILLDGHVEARAEAILWTPSDAAWRWLEGPLFPRVAEITGVDRVLGRLRLISGLVGAEASSDLHLDGEAFVRPRTAGVAGSEVLLPSGDGRRGGDFELWFWLVPLNPLQQTMAGPGVGGFQSPRGVAVDAAGDLLVVDHGHRLLKLDARGEVVAVWGEEGAACGQLESPSDVAVDAAGRIYVADTGNHRIQVFDPTGTFLAAWGGQGSADGELESPMGVAVDDTGRVFVADTGNHRIQVFSAAGDVLSTWGRRGTAHCRFEGPRGIAVDAAHRVYVADTGNHRIQVLSADGVLLEGWGTEGDGEGQFRYPCAIAVDDGGSVYVVDGGNHRIQKFRLRAMG